MVSEKEVAKKEKSVQKKIDYLKTLTEDYKKGVEECNAPKISSDAMFIERQTYLLKEDKEYLTIHQETEIDGLEREYISSFQRLVNGHCICNAIEGK